MGYFDSPKNRAFWSRELAGLKEERELRKMGLSGPGSKQPEQQEDTYHGPKREPVTYKQLLAEEQAEKKNHLESRKGMARSRERTFDKQAEAPKMHMERTAAKP